MSGVHNAQEIAKYGAVGYTQWTIKTWHFIFDYNFG